VSLAGRARVPQALGVLAAVAPLVFLRGNLDPSNLPQVAFVEMGVLLVAMLFVRQESWSWQGLAPVDAPIFGLWFWSGISIFWAHNHFEAVSLWFHWTSCVLAYFLASRARWHKTDVSRFLLGLLVSGFVVALLGVFQWVFHLAWVPQSVPPAATFTNKNMAAQYMVLTLPLGVAFAAGSTRSTGRWLASLASALMAVFLFYTFTRSAWLAVVLQAAVLVAITRLRFHGAGEGRSGVGPALASLGLFLVMVNFSDSGFSWGWGLREVPSLVSKTARAGLMDPSQPLVGEDEGDVALASVGMRKAVWRNTLAMVKDRPIWGRGLGNHKIFYPLYARSAIVDKVFGARWQLDFVHNDYLQILAEMGIVGLVILAWLVIAAFVVLRAVLRETTASADRTVIAGIIASLAGILVDAFFSFPLERAIPPFLVMIELGLCVALLHGGRDEGRRSASPTGRWMGVVVLFAALAATVVVQYGWIKADRHSLRAAQAAQVRDFPRVVAEGEEASRYNTHLREPHFLVGTAFLSMGQPERAIEPLEKARASYPNDLNTLGNLGMALSRTRATEKALECFRAILRLKPDDALAHFRIGEVLEGQGMLPSALDEYRLATRFGPKDALYQYKHGMVALRQHSYEEARVALEQAVSLDPRFAVAHKALGVLFFEILGRPEEGMQHFQKALAIDPQIPDAERMRELLVSYSRTKHS